MITVEKLREAVEKEMDFLPAPIGDRSMVHWFRVAAALEKLLASEPQPRELTREEIHKMVVDEWGTGTHSRFVPRFCRVIRRVIAESRPAMCGPTAEEVKDKLLELLPQNKIEDFVPWYTSRVQPTADVTAPLEKRIAELVKEINIGDDVIRRGIENECNLQTQLTKSESEIGTLKEESEPKPEWPQWRVYYRGVSVLDNAQYARLDSSDSLPVFFHADGSPGGDEIYPWHNSRKKFDRGFTFWLPIPREPDVVRERREKNEWPKYVTVGGVRDITRLRQLDGTGKKSVCFTSHGTEEHTVYATEYYLDGLGKTAFSPIPTTEAEAMIAEAKAKSTERYWHRVFSDGECLWKWNGERVQLRANTSEEWSDSACSVSSLSNPNDAAKEISPAEAEAIMAGWKKEEGG